MGKLEPLNWRTISAQKELGIQFINNNFDYLHKDIICICQELPAEFILEHEDELDLTLCMLKQKSFKDYIELKRNKEIYGE